jgi:hypothetical protein
MYIFLTIPLQRTDPQAGPEASGNKLQRASESFLRRFVDDVSVAHRFSLSCVLESLGRAHLHLV